MRSLPVALRVLFVCLFISSVTSAAPIGFGIRDSALRFEWFRGQDGDIRYTGGSENPSRPLLTDGAALQGGETDEGVSYPSGNWNASANWVVSHGYKVTGLRDDVETISGAGQTSVTTSVQSGYSRVTSDANRLQLEFTVGGETGEYTPVRFRSLLNATGNSNCYVRIDAFTTVGWIAASIRDSAGPGYVDQVLNFSPGLYRVESNAWGQMVDDPSPAFTTFQFTINPTNVDAPDFLEPGFIPEPASLAWIGLAGCALISRYRSRNH